MGGVGRWAGRVVHKVGENIQGMLSPQVVQGQVSYPVPELFPLAKPQVEQGFRNIKDIQSYLGGLSNEVWRGIRSIGEPSTNVNEAALERRMREALLPQLAARGLATSGAGIGAELDIQGRLAENAFQREMERYNAALRRQELLQQAAQGLAVLRSMPEQLRNQLLELIIRQGGTGVPMASSGSIFGQAADIMKGIGAMKK